MSTRPQSQRFPTLKFSADGERSWRGDIVTLVCAAFFGGVAVVGLVVLRGIAP